MISFTWRLLVLIKNREVGQKKCLVRCGFEAIIIIFFDADTARLNETLSCARRECEAKPVCLFAIFCKAHLPRTRGSSVRARYLIKKAVRGFFATFPSTGQHRAYSCPKVNSCIYSSRLPYHHVSNVLSSIDRTVFPNLHGPHPAKNLY